MLPSGWTPLGLVEHLGHAERHWFQEIATGSADPLPWPDDNTPLTTSRPQITDLRGITLHMIEETTRHASHLDIVRELIDGKTGLGPR